MVGPIFTVRAGPSVRNTALAGTCSERPSELAAYAPAGGGGYGRGPPARVPPPRPTAREVRAPDALSGNRTRHGQGHSPRGSGTLAGVFLEGVQDRAFDGRVEVGRQFVRRARRRCRVRSMQLFDRAALVRRLARERFVEHQPQRVEVALDRRLAARQLFAPPCRPACAQSRRCPLELSSRRAKPKSVMRAWPRPSIMTLAGFRSRCNTPFSWAAARPAPSCWAISSPLSLGKRPMRRSKPCRSSPSINSEVPIKSFLTAYVARSLLSDGPRSRRSWTTASEVGR